jgi:colanic acid/amylovoran biosynthesis glycosyltransferase
MKEIIQHIAVVSVHRDKYSETFIHDSFDFFPSKKTLLYGGYLPTHFTEDRRKEGQPIPEVWIPFWKKIGRDDQARQAYFVQRWLKKNRPSVVLAHYGPSGVMMAPICKALKIPLVVHFHGYDAYRADILGTYGLQYPVLFKVATPVVVSWDMQKQLVKMGAPENRGFCSYGVDFARFPAIPIPQGPFDFLFVGRFVPKKAPDLLLRAFAIVQAKLPDVQLKMIGDGELLETCKQLVAELGLEESVSFLGVVPPADVASNLVESHALVLPSRHPADGDSEGMPLVLMEAGAAMRPVIATRHAGIPEIILDGQTGILVPENDVAALAEAMLVLASNRQKAIKLGFEARKRIKDRFTQIDYHQNLWDILEIAVRYPRNS